MAEISDRPMISLVGGDTLLAREIRELLNESKPSPRVQLISATADGSSIIGQEDEETVVMIPLAPASFKGSRVAFLAGSAASSRRTFKMNPPGGPPLIDLTGALESQPEARLRAPSAEAARPRGSSPIQVIAHPAAIAMTMMLSRLAEIAKLRASVAHIFEPASERGQQGLDELHQQTIAALSFQKMKTDVFDAQLGFNLLARYGEEAIEPLESVEKRIEGDLASLLSGHRAIPMPSLRLIQAPVFHGHSFSIWAEFEDNPGPDAIAKALSDSGVDVRAEEPPTNAGIAGQSGLSVGAIETDRNHTRACWIWMVADNLRLAAENAVAVAKESL